MRKYCALLLLLLVIESSPSRGQVSMFAKQHVDTLKAGRATASLYLGFYYMEDALRYLYLSSTVSGLILDSRNQYEIIGLVNYQGLRTRSTSNTGYIFAHCNLFRHTTTDGKRKMSKISLEPFALFQFDEDRGIYARWQAGAYAVPLILNRPKIRIQAGLGFLYQWDRYDLLPPDYEGWWSDEDWKTISEDIRSLEPGGTGFARRNGFRGSVYLGFNGSFGKVFDWNFILFYQQPFASSFQGTPLYSISEDFRIPYPCITAETVMNFRILTWLAMDLRYYFQHDRNQLTFYLPYYMYSVTMGVYFLL
jgi:hypothetical protein